MQNKYAYVSIYISPAGFTPGGASCRWSRGIAAPAEGENACLSITKHDHFTPMEEIQRHEWALARNHLEGWKTQGRGQEGRTPL